MPFPFTVEQKQTALWAAIWLGFVLLLCALGPVLTPFLAAAVLGYALNPGVDRLARVRFGRVGLPRHLAVLIVVGLFLAAILALILIVIPVLRTELPLLQAQIPLFLAKLNDMLGPKLRELGIRVRLDSAGIKTMLTRQLAASGDELWGAVLSSARVGGTAVLGLLTTLVLIPVVLFYLLLDWHPMLARVAGAVPRRWLGRTTAMAREVDAMLAQYLRGQLLVMLVLSVYYSAGLALAGFAVALPVGLVTGMLVFIPYLGFGFGLALALIAAVLQFSGWTGVIAVAVIYGFGQLVESFFLTPRLVGERLGMNPLAVIFALLAFGQLFGFVGVLLALPASAILIVAFKRLRRHYLGSTFYNA